MTVRDFNIGRILMASANAIETLDVSEYLASRGWGAPTLVSTAREAVRLLTEENTRFALVILGTKRSDPATDDVIRMCSEKACPIILIDGEAETAPADHIGFLSRPFDEIDLNGVLKRLRFEAL